MVDGIRCPMCGSDEIAEVLYGMPAYDEGLMARIDAGDVVLNGCGISADDPMHPYDLMRALELTSSPSAAFASISLVVKPIMPNDCKRRLMVKITCARCSATPYSDLTRLG